MKRSLMAVMIVVMAIISGCGNNFEWFPKDQTVNTPANTQAPKFNALCADGWPSPSTTCSGTCASHGGVIKWVPGGALATCGPVTEPTSHSAYCNNETFNDSTSCAGICSGQNGVMFLFGSYSTLCK